MLVTDAGKLIRTPIDTVRIAGRSTQGVTIFNTADDENVVSVEHIPDSGEDEGEEGEGEEGTSPDAPDGGDAPETPEGGDAPDAPTPDEGGEG